MFESGRRFGACSVYDAPQLSLKKTRGGERGPDRKTAVPPPLGKASTEYNIIVLASFGAGVAAREGDSVV